MKLIFLFLIIALMQATASTKAQTITLNRQNISITAVFEEIMMQSDYDFSYSEQQISKVGRINISVTNASINEVLDKCFEGQALTYTISNNTITIKDIPQSFFKKILKRFSTVIISGIVSDEQGKILPGATVKLQGSKITTRTDDKGFFSLNSDEESGVLSISYLGYVSEQVRFSSNNLGPFKVILKQEIGALEEVEINAGYYTVKDRERTGSISRVTAQQIEKQPVNNLLQAIQANVPGLQVVQNTGVPGGGFTVRIRGQNSINNGNDPFYIIDGVPFTAAGLAGSRSSGITLNANPLASINPSDIQSIEVLKDADATAIYGSRGANGVILITTKKGSPGKARTSFSISQGLSKVANKMNLMNTEQYLAMRKEAFSNDKIAPGTTDYDVNGTWGNERDIDWQKELIGGIAPTTNILTSLSGGTNNVTYLIGGGYYNEGTVFPGKNSYARSSGSFSLQYNSSNKKFRASFDSNYSQINSNLFATDLTQFITLVPNYPQLLGENGSLNWSNNTLIQNPIANTLQTYNAKTNNLISNAALTYCITPDLNIKTSLGYTIMDRKESGGDPLTTFSPALNYGTDRRRSFFSNYSTNNWIIEAQVDWNKEFGQGEFNALVGTTFQENLTDGHEIRGAGYNSDALIGNIAAASTFTIPGRSYLQYRYTAIFGRFNYQLQNKYFINLTGRRDGSSRFGIRNRFANFGAIGAAWIISKEDFMKNNFPFISLAKLRGSYGVTGNDQIRDYGYLELWNAQFTYQGISTMVPQQLANANYAWEVNKKAEVAFEIGLFDDKIKIAAGYYSNRSSNQLIAKQLAPSTGFTSITDNLPAKVGNTGWEFELNTKNISNKVFSWSSSLNLTIPKNRLIEYPNIETSGVVTLYAVGQPLSIKKLYNTSVDSQSGLYISEDYDNNGVIDFKDQYIIEFTGRRYYGGIQNSFSFKGIGLDFLFQYVKQKGNSYLNGFNMPGLGFFSAVGTVNQPIDVIEHWRKPDNNTRFQKYTTLSSANSGYTNAIGSGSLAVDDTSFLRLKNASISYTLPSKILKKIRINNARFFLQGQNLFTITTYKGLDPETQNLTRLPLLQTFNAGIQLTL